MEKSSKLLLSVGGNTDNSREKFERLWSLLEEKVGKVERISHFYRTPPWGFVSENDFVNAVALVLTALPPLEVLTATEEIERLLGRRQKSTGGVYSDRSMDIDLIAYGDVVCRDTKLTLPHPLMHRRRFVLQPLCDICPEWVHPLLHKDVRTLLAECADDSGELQQIYL